MIAILAENKPVNLKLQHSMKTRPDRLKRMLSLGISDLQSTRIMIV